MTIEATSVSNNDKDSLMFWMAAAGTDAFAGALSGAISRTITAPIERVKLILQLQRSSPSLSQTQTTAISNNGSTNNALNVCHEIYRNEGILAFWRGNLQNVIRVAGQAALNFALMERYKHLALSIMTQQHSSTKSTSSVDKEQLRSSQRKHQTFVVSFVAGGLAGGTATTVLYPTEFLRTRLALDLGKSNRQYRGMWDVTTQILGSDGIRGLYKGYGISLVGSVVYRLLYLGGYDAVKIEWQFWKQHQLQRKQQTGNNVVDGTAMTWMERLISAQVVSLLAGTMCYPIDSVRRRMMMQAGKPLHEQLYHNSLQCFAIIWKREGIQGFYLGFGPNILRSVGGALTLVAYDGLRGILVS
jgi:solute carrier family 25 (mitochondrial adenine nucleotide translocator), member 4/5/6/31